MPKFVVFKHTDGSLIVTTAKHEEFVREAYGINEEIDDYFAINEINDLALVIDVSAQAHVE